MAVSDPLPPPPSGRDLWAAVLALLFWSLVTATSCSAIVLACELTTVRFLGMSEKDFFTAMILAAAAIAIQLALEWRLRHMARAIRRLRKAAITERRPPEGR